MRSWQNFSKITAIVLFLILNFLSFNRCSHVFQEHIFRGILGCDKNYKTNGTEQVDYSSISQIECALKCVSSSSCFGINYCATSAVRSCQLVSNLNTPLSCKDLEYCEGCSYYHKGPCWNGGIYRPADATCLCPYLYSGAFCHRYNFDCVEPYDRGYRQAATTMVEPNSELSPFVVKCRLKDGPLARIIKRDRNGVDLFVGRSWNDYKWGFGSPSRKNMWLGLENIHALTISGGRDYTAKISVIFTSNNSSHIGYLDHFQINSESTNYTISFSGFRSDVNKPLPNPFLGTGSDNSMDGRPFCTPDNDCEECATNSNSGWWFSQGCAGVNWNLPAGDLVWPNDSNLIQADRIFVDLTPL